MHRLHFYKQPSPAQPSGRGGGGQQKEVIKNILGWAGELQPEPHSPRGPTEETKSTHRGTSDTFQIRESQPGAGWDGGLKLPKSQQGWGGKGFEKLELIGNPYPNAHLSKKEGYVPEGEAGRKESADGWPRYRWGPAT